jgi:CHASE3 domain sensor protein
MGGAIVALAVLPLVAFFSLHLISESHSDYRGMALPTVGCLILLAVAILRRPTSTSAEDSPALSFLAAALGMLISIGVVLVQKNSELIEANEMVTHTYAVRSNIDFFNAEVARVESAVRGLILTGDESFHTLGLRHREEAARQLKILERMVEDNPGQVARLRSLNGLTRQKIEAVEKMVQLRATKGASAAAESLNLSTASLTSSLVNQADEIKLEEDRLLDERTRLRAELARDARVMEALGSLIALGLMAAGVSAVGAQPSATQQRYEQQVARCNDGTLPAPSREACIRAAGNSLDNASGGPPAEAAVPSRDGRATVVAPEGTTPSSGGAGTVPSRDGRALIVPSAESAPAR